MEYMTVKEAGERWGLGIRVVALYCAGGRIEGAVKKGNLWLLPEDAVKPSDKRRKRLRGKGEMKSAVSQEPYDTYEQEKREDTGIFGSLYENTGLFAEIVKRFPHPMHICAPDGTMLVANEAYLKFAKITNPDRIYGKHNILHNPLLEKWGIKDFVLQAFQGKEVHAFDVKVPYREIIERLGDEREPVSESLFQNMTAFPIHDNNCKLMYVVFVFITSRSYRDREEIAKGREYIDDHWKEEFDMGKLTDVVHMSKYHYTRLFKQHIGMSPFDYYRDLKLCKLKEKLCDTNLSITQAFKECGMDYNGKSAKKFKDKAGMTPSQYRAEMIQR